MSLGHPVSAFLVVFKLAVTSPSNPSNPHPTVQVLSAHLPEGQQTLFSSNPAGLCLIYFNQAAMDTYMHVVVHQHSDPSFVHKTVSVINKGGLEIKENQTLSDALALEEMKQSGLTELDLNDTSVYIQRLPMNAIQPNFIIQFDEHKTRYLLLENRGVSQWYFQASTPTDRYASLPPDSAICEHGFFNEDLVPVTRKTLRDIYALYDAANPGRKCKSRSSHRHFRFHIYINIDMSMVGPWGGSTKYVVVTACEDATVADLFSGAGGEAARNDEHLLRNFSWGSFIPGQTQCVLVTGVPYCYGTVKDTHLVLHELGWNHDEGVVWLYPCKLVKGRSSSA